MPKLSERDRLADLEARRRKLELEIIGARNAVRERYAAIVRDLPVEALGEREFRELLLLVSTMGGAKALQALNGSMKPPPTGNTA